MIASPSRRGPTVHEAMGGALPALEAAGVPTPRLDAEVLLAAATGWGRADLAADPGRPLSAAASRAFGEFVRRRLRREPVAYILGRRGFRRIEVAVDRRVLIPRPETELLVEVAVELGPRTVLDVGTGSGAIALAVADELPGCSVVATDASEDALAVARENASRLGLDGRVRIAAGTPEGGPFDLALANLPYVTEAEWAGLQPEVRDWEPREALVGGRDGLDVIREVVPRLTARCVALEVGAGQAEAVAALLAAAGRTGIEVREDLAGIGRVVVGTLA